MFTNVHKFPQSFHTCFLNVHNISKTPKLLQKFKTSKCQKSRIPKPPNSKLQTKKQTTFFVFTGFPKLLPCFERMLFYQLIIFVYPFYFHFWMGSTSVYPPTPLGSQGVRESLSVMFKGVGQAEERRN